VLFGEQNELAPAFLHRNYRFSPVSPLYVFGRPPDMSGSGL
jgi:hypothetical protein